MKGSKEKEELKDLLSRREALLLQLIAKHGKVKDAVYFINYSEDRQMDLVFPEKDFKKSDGTVYKARLSEWAAYQMLRRIRTRYLRARNFVNRLVSLRNRYPSIDKVLAPKVRLSAEEEEEEEEGRH